MAAILDLIASERRSDSGDTDFRPRSSSPSSRIAELETMPPSRARRAFDEVAKDGRRLELSLAKLPPSARRLVEVEVSTRRARELEKADWQDQGRPQVARGRAALDLMLDHGGTCRRSTRDGRYVGLANLLYFVATGEGTIWRVLQAALRRPQGERSSTSTHDERGHRAQQRARAELFETERRRRAACHRAVAAHRAVATPR